MQEKSFFSICRQKHRAGPIVQYTRSTMTLIWIALVLAVGTLGIVVAAVRRHAAGVELGSMSASWVAEQRAGEQSYYER